MLLLRGDNDRSPSCSAIDPSLLDCLGDGPAVLPTAGPRPGLDATSEHRHHNSNAAAHRCRSWLEPCSQVVVFPVGRGVGLGLGKKIRRCPADHCIPAILLPRHGLRWCQLLPEQSQRIGRLNLPGHARPGSQPENLSGPTRLDGHT
ncbi:MAG: Uncharacterised protein [Prochlorococcus marinus str. MIT 9215]|nr:MAG: Uncharacterised protein [Prochlorococcus marinus str. MIT 9215]